MNTRLFAPANTLRGARQRRGWSLEEAAAKVGIDHSNLSRWETDGARKLGRRTNGLVTARLLHDLYNGEVPYLLKLKGLPDSKTAKAALRERLRERRVATGG